MGQSHDFLSNNKQNVPHWYLTLADEGLQTEVE